MKLIALAAALFQLALNRKMHKRGGDFDEAFKNMCKNVNIIKLISGRIIF